MWLKNWIWCWSTTRRAKIPDSSIIAALDWHDRYVIRITKKNQKKSRWTWWWLMGTRLQIWRLSTVTGPTTTSLHLRFLRAARCLWPCVCVLTLVLVLSSRVHSNLSSFQALFLRLLFSSRELLACCRVCLKEERNTAGVLRCPCACVRCPCACVVTVFLCIHAHTRSLLTCHRRKH